MKKLNRCFSAFTLALLVPWILSGCQETPAEDHDEIIRAGLAEILSHQESGCGKVGSWETDSRFDYLVTCESGMRYRIHVGNEGHVNVKEHSASEVQQ